MPEQIKAEICRLSEEFEEHNGLIYANSGLFCIEREMEDFASKYSAYNKCQMVLVFLNEVVAETNRRITTRTNTLKRNREKRQQELDVKKQELITTITGLTSDRERDYGRDTRTHIRAFVATEMDYSYDSTELDQLDDQVAAQHSAEANYSAQESGFEKAKGTMWDHLKTHGQNLFSGDFKHTLVAMRDDLVKDFARVQSSKESMDAMKRDIDSKTSDDIMGIVIERYKASLLEAKERLSSATKFHWQNNAQALKELFAKFDALLLPAYSKADFEGYPVEDAFQKVFAESLFTAPASITGMPAVVTSGVQLLGDYFCDGKLLALAKTLEKEEA
jgi:hypothetical protein